MAWEELAKLSGGAHWTIANIHSRLDAGNTPWQGYAPRAIGPAMAAMDYKPGK
ncbi:hypothetical protein D3C85_1943840 [compost metagenome]